MLPLDLFFFIFISELLDFNIFYLLHELHSCDNKDQL